MFLYLILIVLIILILIALYDRCNRKGKLIRKIPGPWAWPIIGNSMYLMVSPEKLFLFIRSLSKNYGDFSQIHGINLRTVHISNPDVMQKLLSSPEYVFKSDPYTFAAPWLGDGLLISNGNKWHQRRKMITKAFHFNILKKFALTFKKEVEVFLEKVEEETVKEQTDLFALVSPAALSIICDTAMGITLREDENFENYFTAVHTLGECIMLRVFNIWLYNDKLFSLSKLAKTQTRMLSHVHGFTKKVIKDKRLLFEETKLEEMDDDSVDVKKEKIALLDLLLLNEKHGNIDEEGIREEVDTFMFEGFDTSSMALSFFFMAIANEPVIQDKIYEELLSVLGDSERLPTMEELSELKYLECCIKESLRLYPSVPFIIRQLLNDTELNGYTVPAGTNCFFHFYDLHRRADIYPDPERFDPDRFLPENSLRRHVYAYLPFSAGPRNCIGQKFAMLEIKTCIAGVLRRFRVEPVTKPSELVYTSHVLLRTIDPLYVRFRPRN